MLCEEGEDTRKSRQVARAAGRAAAETVTRPVVTKSDFPTLKFLKTSIDDHKIDSNSGFFQ